MKNLQYFICHLPDSDLFIFKEFIFNLFSNYINIDIFLCGYFNIDF